MGQDPVTVNELRTGSNLPPLAGGDDLLLWPKGRGELTIYSKEAWEQIRNPPKRSLLFHLRKAIRNWRAQR